MPAFDAEGVVQATAPLGTGAWKPADENKNLDGGATFRLDIPLYDFRDDPEFQSRDTSTYPESGQVTDRDPIGEIAGVSFKAWHPAGQPLRYYIYPYTQPDGVDDAASRDGYRLIGASSQARSIDAPEEQWVTFSLAGSTNQIVFRDKRVGSIPRVELATLADLTAGPYTRGDDTDDTDLSPRHTCTPAFAAALAPDDTVRTVTTRWTAGGSGTPDGNRETGAELIVWNGLGWTVLDSHTADEDGPDELCTRLVADPTAPSDPGCSGLVDPTLVNGLFRFGPDLTSTFAVRPTDPVGTGEGALRSEDVSVTVRYRLPAED